MTTEDTFLCRKERELRIKLGGLPKELEHWRALSRANEPLAKNHSQLDRVTYRVEGFQQKVEQELTDTMRAGGLWRRAEALEGKALMVHMIWDFFRTRFSQRTQPPFDRYLALADAFARACYEPAIRLLNNIPADKLCVTPLVTFNDQISPWATAIQQSAPDADSTGVFTAQQFTQAVESMPVALVGVPWSYLTYLPHMALLGHEVAHSVERDGGLTQTLADALSATLATNDRREAWQAWMREVFADLYGCWMAGPAFVWSLSDFLAGDQASIGKQTRPHSNGDWTGYPTATLRVRFACRVLEQRQFKTEAAQILRVWQASYPEAFLSDHLQPFAEDFEVVSDCLAQTARLKELRPAFTPAFLSMAATNCDLLVAGAQIDQINPPPQVYVSTARLLMSRNLEESALLAMWQRLVDHHVETRTPGVLGENAQEPAVDPGEERRQGEALAFF